LNEKDENSDKLSSIVEMRSQVKYLNCVSSSFQIMDTDKQDPPPKDNGAKQDPKESETSRPTEGTKADKDSGEAK
ncbi:hypothetical protein Ocin01_05064, partial [Orchesella cincta]